MAKCEESIQRIKAEIGKLFAHKDMGALSFLLGIEIKRKSQNQRQGFQINQTSSIERTLNRLGSLYAFTPKNTPLKFGDRLLLGSGSASEEHTSNFQSAIGSLLHFSRMTRPDISASVNILGRFSSNPDKSHIDALSHLLGCLERTKDHVLKIEFSDTNAYEIVGYTDSDWAGDLNDRKSTSGYDIRIGKNQVSWGSQKQYCVALSQWNPSS